MTDNWNWGTPTNIDIPSRAEKNPANFPSLKFHPVGLYDLRRRLGSLPSSPGIYNLYKTRFDASDIAWFAAGSSLLPPSPSNQFSSNFHAIYKATSRGISGNLERRELRSKVRDLTFDMAALWDSTFGGTTLVIHVDGGTRPGTPLEAEFLKSDVYFPAFMHAETSTMSHDVADIVQKFIRKVGIPTVARFERLARLIWPLNQTGPEVQPLPAHGVVPPATPHGSSRYTYHGLAIERSSDSPTPPPSTPPRSIAEEDTDSLSDSEAEEEDQTQTIAAMGSQLRDARSTIENLRSRERVLLARLATANDWASTPSSTFRRPPIHSPSPKRPTSNSSTILEGEAPIEIGSNPSNYKTANNSPLVVTISPASKHYKARPDPKTPLQLSSHMGRFLQDHGLSYLHTGIIVIQQNLDVSEWEIQLKFLGMADDLVVEVMKLMARAE